MLVESLAGARRCALAAFRRASAEELKELGEEIRAQADLDTANGPFWEATKVLCDAEILKAAGSAGRSGVYFHSEVAADVMSVVEGKNLEELDAMQQTIAVRMAAGESKIGDQLQEVIGLIRRRTIPATTRRPRLMMITRQTRNAKTTSRTPTRRGRSRSAPSHCRRHRRRRRRGRSG
uniref:Splicing factor cactin central domain-containing protein n=1 Tax=Setaria viridis TaxID=4556 RepID=A0A4U6TT97_SETVI|nr:hypothetical protein SEVIR_7G207601v2 [Setaria viridis]